MSCTDEADELPSSPPNMRKGLPSTISWVAVPCDCKKLFLSDSRFNSKEMDDKK